MYTLLYSYIHFYTMNSYKHTAFQVMKNFQINMSFDNILYFKAIHIYEECIEKWYLNKQKMNLQIMNNKFEW